MSIVGQVAYQNAGRGFVLLTPLGKSREYDIYGRCIWFFVGGVGDPYTGMIVEFDVSRTQDGSIEAINVRHPKLQPPSAGINGLAAEARAGAAPAAALAQRPPPASIGGSDS